MSAPAFVGLAVLCFLGGMVAGALGVLAILACLARGNDRPLTTPEMWSSTIPVRLTAPPAPPTDAETVEAFLRSMADAP